MPRLIWSAPALRDVQRLNRFLARKDAGAAKRAVNAIREGVRIAGHRAEVGRPAAEMEPEFREWLVEFGDSGYVALYRYDGQTAVILAVRQQRELEY